MQYQNPIIRGFNPDPSICRVGEDYYLVTSTFEFFPGVPIYHSKNLIDWELIGHCLTRPEQLPLEGVPASRGIYAPTIRYHNGRFYMTTTLVGLGNFIVYTDDIYGEWSEMIPIDQPGIDPSLLFVGDDCYFCSNYRQVEHGISLCRIDPNTGERFTEMTTIGTGTGGRCCEAPHLYQIGDWFYLMMAEGGTEYGHMVTIKRSRNIWGPYENCPRNPIFSHRDAKTSPIQCTGHADMIQDQFGNWWAVHLATRSLGRLQMHNLGRETFLIPVTWDEEGWPVFGENGRVSLTMDGPLWEKPQGLPTQFIDDFNTAALKKDWSYVRNPESKNYRIGPEGLVMTAGAHPLSSMSSSPTALLRRQQEHITENVLQILTPKAECYGGLTAYISDAHHYDVFVSRDADGAISVGVRKTIYDLCCETVRVPVPAAETLFLRISSDRDHYFFAWSTDGVQWDALGKGASAALCTEVIYTVNFTGVQIGPFCEEGELNVRRFTAIETREA